MGVSFVHDYRVRVQGLGFGGDLGLVDEIQRIHAQVAGTAEEVFLLAGNQGNDGQVFLPEMPYSLEQLQQMQAAAASIVASKEGICNGSTVTTWLTPSIHGLHH